MKEVQSKREVSAPRFAPTMDGGAVVSMSGQDGQKTADTFDPSASPDSPAKKAYERISPRAPIARFGVVFDPKGVPLS